MALHIQFAQTALGIQRRYYRLNLAIRNTFALSKTTPKSKLNHQIELGAFMYIAYPSFALFACYSNVIGVQLVSHKENDIILLLCISWCIILIWRLFAALAGAPSANRRNIVTFSLWNRVQRSCRLQQTYSVAFTVT